MQMGGQFFHCFLSAINVDRSFQLKHPLQCWCPVSSSAFSQYPSPIWPIMCLVGR